MDCRTFKSRLEDYLEGGLDFPGRFGMERHAQQCFSCGKMVTDAQELGQVAREYRRVTAPPNFEAAVLQRIRAEKAKAGFWRSLQYRFLDYDWPLLRPVTIGVSMAALLGLGVLIPLYLSPRPEPVAGPVSLPERPAPMQAVSPDTPARAELTPNLPEQVRQTIHPAKRRAMPVRIESADSEYFECLVPGPGGRLRIVSLPKTIRMRYAQSSQQYFIRNVSH